MGKSGDYPFFYAHPIRPFFIHFGRRFGGVIPNITMTLYRREPCYWRSSTVSSEAATGGCGGNADGKSAQQAFPIAA